VIVWKSHATQYTDDGDENDTAEGGNGDLAKPARGGDPDKTRQPASDETKAAPAYQHAGQPTGHDPADDPDKKM
jgi:hypothetical protein